MDAEGGSEEAGSGDEESDEEEDGSGSVLYDSEEEEIGADEDSSQQQQDSEPAPEPLNWEEEEQQLVGGSQGSPHGGQGEGRLVKASKASRKLVAQLRRQAAACGFIEAEAEQSEDEEGGSDDEDESEEGEDGGALVGVIIHTAALLCVAACFWVLCGCSRSCPLFACCLCHTHPLQARSPHPHHTTPTPPHRPTCWLMWPRASGMRRTGSRCTRAGRMQRRPSRCGSCCTPSSTASSGAATTCPA
jgi:hypothetical protein